MSAVLNYTDRKKIPSERVRITLTESAGGASSFEAALDLSDMGPAQARVFVEASAGPISFVRFDFGTVGAVLPPDDRGLGDLDLLYEPRFRVKIVGVDNDAGRVLAMAEGLTAEEGGGGELGRITLLRVRYMPLGDRVWKLLVADGPPEVIVNKDIPRIREIVRSDGTFASLVWPEVVRGVLATYLLNDHIDEDAEDDDWPQRWLRFVRGFHAAPLVPWNEDREDACADERLEWIEQAVAAFCRVRQFKDLFEKAMTREGS